MARGWESKSVEAQQDEAARDRPKRAVPTPEERVTRDRRRTLELSRTRAAGDLARATAPAHRKMLEQAIASLDAELKELGTT